MTSENDNKSDAFSAAEIASFRPFMYKLALLQLRDASAAEDATQDALVAAIEKRHTFEGRASLRTWLTSILRFKVLDIMRKKARAPVAIDTSLMRQLDLTTTKTMFDQDGCWADNKASWSDPVEHTEQLEFFQVLEACMKKLPATMSRVFLMREWLDLSSSEIGTDLGLSAGNVRVLLYRARMHLRACLERNWECER